MTRSALLGGFLVADMAYPMPQEIDLDFMSYRMRTIVRFTGHPAALTLDEHQRLAVAVALHLGLTPEAVEWAERHDCHEYALGDHIRPLVLAGGYGAQLEALKLRWDAAIVAALGIEAPSDSVRAEVEEADRIAMAIEWCFALDRPFDELGLPAKYEGLCQLPELLWAVVGSERSAEIMTNARIFGC